MPRKVTQEEYISKVTALHGGKYTYEKLLYTVDANKVEITCPEHGSWWQSASSHKQGVGCNHCGREATRSAHADSKEAFIKKAKIVHGESYKYDLVEYRNLLTHVIVTCHQHGNFNITPGNHLSGKGCVECWKQRRWGLLLKSNEDFVKDCKEIHGGTYDYSETNYTGSHLRVSVNCRVHGKFRITATAHLTGTGCNKCNKHGFNRGNRGLFYVLSAGNITKVGITNKTVESRANQISKSSGFNFSPNVVFEFEEGSQAWAVEKKTLTYLRSKCLQVSAQFDGSTECFVNVDLKDLLSFITPLATASVTQ